MQRVCASWVPRILKDGGKRKCSEEFLLRLRSARGQFSIPTDKTRPHYSDPKGKPESSVLKTPRALQPSKNMSISTCPSCLGTSTA